MISVHWSMLFLSLILYGSSCSIIKPSFSCFTVNSQPEKFILCSLCLLRSLFGAIYFIFLITNKISSNWRISYVGGLGTSRCIMGLTTQDPYIQKEHTELYKILNFRVNWANIEQDTAIQKLENLQRNVWISGQVSGNPYICW